MASSEELKEESCLICGSGCGESPPPSRKQISFLLSRILELPQEQIDFSEFYSSQGEESLVKICVECSSNFVYECVQVRKELAEVQKRVEEADLKLISKIKDSVEEEDGGPGDTSGFVNVTHEIRSFVYNRSYQVNTSADVKSKASGTVSASAGIQNSLSKTKKIHGKRGKELVGDSENNSESSFPSRCNIEGSVEETLISEIKSEVPEPNLAPEEPDNSTLLDFLNEDDIQECGEKLPQRPRRQERKCSLEVVEPPEKSPKKPKESLPGKVNDTPFKRRKKSSPNKPEQVQNKILKEPVKLKKLCVFCDLCRERLPRESNLQHVRDHVKDYTLKCQTPNCPRALCSIRHYNNHVFNCKPPGQSTPNPRFPTVCEVCGFQGVSQVGLLRHLQFLHESCTAESDQSLSCPVTPCPEVFSHRQTVYHHISLKHAAPRKNFVMTAGDGMQLCRTCSKSFPQDKILAHFVTDHAASADLVVSCSHCPYLSLNRDEYLKHLKIHFRLGLVVGCDLCPSPINFSRYDLFRKHYFKSHQIGEAFPCQQCEAFFVNAKQLMTHRKKFHERSLVQRVTKRFKCDECPENGTRFYLHERNVRDHKIKVHGAEPYKCSSCPETFLTWVDLKTHEKRHNSSMKQFKCVKCPRTFTTKGVLNRHVKVHASMKDFKCEHCGMEFRRRDNLSRHINSIHQKTKPHPCPSREETFIQEANLSVT